MEKSIAYAHASSVFQSICVCVCVHEIVCALNRTLASYAMKYEKLQNVAFILKF